MDKLKNVLFFVEATPYEALCVWEEYHNKCNWRQDTGFSLVVGYVNDDSDLPVNVNFSLNYLNDKLFCFYDVVSRYNDSVMVEEWIKKNHPAPMTDAMNFHLCYNALIKDDHEKDL